MVHLAQRALRPPHQPSSDDSASPRARSVSSPTQTLASTQMPAPALSSSEEVEMLRIRRSSGPLQTTASERRVLASGPVSDGAYDAARRARVRMAGMRTASNMQTPVRTCVLRYEGLAASGSRGRRARRGRLIGTVDDDDEAARSGEVSSGASCDERCLPLALDERAMIVACGQNARGRSRLRVSLRGHRHRLRLAPQSRGPFKHITARMHVRSDRRSPPLPPWAWRVAVECLSQDVGRRPPAALVQELPRTDLTPLVKLRHSKRTSSSGPSLLPSGARARPSTYLASAARLLRPRFPRKFCSLFIPVTFFVLVRRAFACLQAATGR